MLPMREIAVLLLGLMLTLSGPLAEEPKTNGVHVTARVVQQRYCTGDAEAFTVSIAVEINVETSSKATAHVLWPMVPLVGKVASSIEEAESGHFLYQQTATHYPQGQIPLQRLKIEPDKKVPKRIKYYLIAKHDPASSLPKSVSPGKYAMVLVLGPEEEPPSPMHSTDTIKRITTEPFVVEVPSQPKLVSCEIGVGKAR